MVACSIHNCKSRTKRGSGISFHMIPTVIVKYGDYFKKISEARRNAWVQAIRQEKFFKPNFVIQKWHRVCGLHFISGKPAALEDINSPDWVPTLNLGYLNISSCTPHSMLSGHGRVLDRETIKEEHTSLDSQSDFHTFNEEIDVDNNLSLENEPVSSLYLSCNEAHTESDISDKNILNNFKMENTSSCDQADASIYFTESSCQTDLTMKDIEQLLSNMGSLKERLSDQTKNFIMDQNYIVANEERAKYYTGLPTLTILMGIFSTVSAHMIRHNNSKLTLFQEFLITLLKLRLNLDFKDLSYRFNVSTSTISRVWTRWIDVLCEKLDQLIKWPTPDELQSTMPDCFKKSFVNKVAVITDCFEIAIERPSSLDDRTDTRSHYKHHKTMKYLIGVSPQGTVTFISKSWASNSSVKYITEECGILEKLNPGDLILSDKGFNISETVGFSCAEVALPAFTRGKKQLYAMEFDDTTKISDVRIHVKRCIGLVRNKYQILNEAVPVEYISTKNDCEKTKLDKILKVCCSLVNSCNSVVTFD